MLSQQDLKQIAQKGITQEQIENQLNEFKTGFPFLKLEAAAGIGRGIIAPDAAARKQYEDIWNAYKADGKRVVKFVPASGAASRMFKDMFAFVDANYDVPTTDFEKKYFDSIEKFAFYEALDAACQKNEGKGIKALIAKDCCCSTSMLRDHARRWRNIWWKVRFMPPLTVRLMCTSP